MLTDALYAFVPINSNLSIVAAAGVAVPSNVVDLLGVGVGQAPQNIIGNATVFGADMGIGDNRALVEAIVGTAFVTANSATLTVALQGAVDTGAAGGYQPGTWQTLVQTPAMAAAQLTAGKIIAKLDFPPAFPDGTLPRFLRLLFQTPTGEYFTAGTIASAIVTMARDDYTEKYAAKNYTV
jgi:hypothetical protein